MWTLAPVETLNGCSAPQALDRRRVSESILRVAVSSSAKARLPKSALRSRNDLARWHGLTFSSVGAEEDLTSQKGRSVIVRKTSLQYKQSRKIRKTLRDDPCFCPTVAGNSHRKRRVSEIQLQANRCFPYRRARHDHLQRSTCACVYRSSY